MVSPGQCSLWSFAITVRGSSGFPGSSLFIIPVNKIPEILASSILSMSWCRVFETVLSSLAIVILHCTCCSRRLGRQPAEDVAC